MISPFGMNCFIVLTTLAVLASATPIFYSADGADSETSYEEVRRTTPEQRPIIRNAADLEKVFRESGIPLEIQRQLLQRDLTIGDVFGTKDDQGSQPDNMSSSAFDPWSIIWYIGAFGGLIAFFLVVSCSEWCCGSRRSDRPGVGERNPNLNVSRCQQQQQVAGTPPPSYHLFAPPSYDTCSLDSQEKTDKFDVYVVPVHSVDVEFIERNQNTINDLPPPPCYTAINSRPT